MPWTKDKPSRSGWYWYREPGLNMNRPMPAWVYDLGRDFYASLMAVHSEPVVKNVKDCKGEWEAAGSMEVPS